MLISWKKGVSGDLATASNWDPAAVPGPADDAIIGAKGIYTVTSSINETVDSLTIVKKGATVFITGASDFTTTNGGVNDGTILVDNASVLNVGTTGQSTTLTNLGQIELGSAANGELVLAGDVSLQGNGKVILSDNPDHVIAGNGSPATLSTDNVISGAGLISGVSLVNEVGGIIDATGVNQLSVRAPTIDNSGILEATNPQRLSTTGGLFVQFSTINNTPLGVIEANGANTAVSLFDDTVVGGTLETKGANAVIHAGATGGVVFDGTQPGNPVNIEGNVLVDAHSSLTLMGTINNTGVITVASDDGDFAAVGIVGNVTLEGGGQITLTDTRPSGPETPTFISGGVLTNVDNTISGTGIIGGSSFDPSSTGILINEAQGIIDANNASAPLIIHATAAKDASSTNSGLIEATHGGTLLISGVIVNTTNGTVEASHGSTIGLEGGNIVGGVVTVMHGAIIEAEQAAGTIFAAVVTNAGTIGAEDANLTIFGDVTNARGTLDANNATLIIDGAVCGGKATLEGTGEIEFGAASTAHVTFAANSNAILKLDDPSTFTGTVSGLTTGDYIDLTNINFADNPTLSYSSKTHVLTVTDSVSHVTDTITFKGAVGSFSAQSDGNGGTYISDPPAIVTVSHDSFVFAPNLGESTTANFNAHNETIDPARSEFADLAALLSQEHRDGANPIAHDATDIVHHAEALAAQHAHHFFV